MARSQFLARIVTMSFEKGIAWVTGLILLGLVGDFRFGTFARDGWQELHYGLPQWYWRKKPCGAAMPW